MNKLCNTCGETKPLEECFYKQTLPKGGYASQCKQCIIRKNNERRRLNDTRPRSEQFLLKKDGMRKCKQCGVVKSNTAEVFLVVDGFVTSPCRECHYADKRAKYVPRPPRPPRGANIDPEKLKAKRARQRARRRGAHVKTFTAQQWAEVLNYFNLHCAYCNQKFDSSELTQDHIVPVSRDGQHEEENIVPACKSCNGSKQDLDLLSFLGRQVSGTRFKRVAVRNNER